MDENHQNSLLKEYELCQMSVNHQDNMAWVIGSIFIVQSFAGLYFMATIERFIIATLIGFFSTILLWLWYFIYKRWTSFVEVSHYRMHEIEKELDLWKNRYINFLDSGTYPDFDTKSKEKLDKLFSALAKKHWQRSLHKNVKWMVILTTIFCIIILTIRAFTQSFI